MPPALEAQYPYVLALTASPYGTPSLLPGNDPHFRFYPCSFSFCALFFFFFRLLQPLVGAKSAHLHAYSCSCSCSSCFLYVLSLHPFTPILIPAIGLISTLTFQLFCNNCSSYSKASASLLSSRFVLVLTLHLHPCMYLTRVIDIISVDDIISASCVFTLFTSDALASFQIPPCRLWPWAVLTISTEESPKAGNAN